MKCFSLMVVVLAVLAMIMGGSQAAPEPQPAGAKGLLKGAKTVIGVVGAIGTGKEIIDRVRNRHG